MTAQATIGFADEMRLGLHSQLRRRWCPRGVTLVQPQQMPFQWQWLALSVDVVTGQLLWRWQKNLRAPSVREAAAFFLEKGVSALVWDNAPAHRANVVKEAGPALCYLPPFSPELNPAERVFEEVRRCVEGRLWDSLQDKVAAVEAFLSELAADPARVRRLAGWEWIRIALARLPAPPDGP